MKFFIILFALTVGQTVYAQFTHESEVSLIQTGGNSEIQTNNFKTVNKQAWSLNTLGFGGHYTYGETGEAVSARNWDVNSKYERELNAHLSIIAGEIIEGNKFTGIKARYNTDLGLKYFYIKSEKKLFFSEVSYRYSIEDRYAPIENTYDNKGRLYNEWDHKYSQTMQYKLWVEYVPNFTDGKDYLVNGEASLTSILNSLFSLKIAYKGMYDNKPAFSGFKNYDFMTTTSLVAKF